MNLKDNAYFNTLPAIDQESILQSGLDFADESALRRFVENLLKSH